MKTKKIKQSGSGFLSRLKERVFRKKNKKEESIKKPQSIKPQSIKKESSTILDKLFKKLCASQLEKYKNNPSEEKRGRLFKACKYIFNEKFAKYDDEAFDKYVQEQEEITRNRPTTSIIEEKNKSPTDEERGIFLKIESLEKQLTIIADEYYKRIVASHPKNNLDKIDLKNTLKKLESEMKKINGEIRELYQQKKILPTHRMQEFNEQYNKLVNSYKDTLLDIRNKRTYEKKNIDSLKLENNNVILNSSGKRIFTPSREKLDSNQQKIDELYKQLADITKEITKLNDDYFDNVILNDTSSINNIRRMHGLVSRYFVELKKIQRTLKHIKDTYTQLVDEYKTYKNDLSKPKLDELENIKDIYIKTNYLFEIVFKIITSKNKEKLALPDFKLDKDNFNSNEKSTQKKNNYVANMDYTRRKISQMRNRFARRLRYSAQKP